MKILKKNVQRNYKRNKDIVASGVKVTSGGSSALPPLDFLPATLNSDGSYSIPVNKVLFVGSVEANGEVTAHKDGIGGGSTEGSVTVYDGLDSTDTTVALSANLGRILKDMVDNKEINLTNYYTKDDTNKLLEPKADKTFVEQKIADLVNGAPETMDTLKELSDVLIESKDAVEAINKSITNKADKVHTHTTADITDLDTKLTKYDTHIADNVKHISADERKKWNDASTNQHTHTNKAVLDGIKSTDISNWNNKLDKKTWDDVFTVDNGDLKVKLNIIGDGEISAYGKGEQGTGVITIADNLTTSASDVALSARQGVILKSMIDNKEINLTNYYNKQEVDSKVTPKADKTYVDGKVKDLNTAISGKANTKHTHLKADITDLDLTGYDKHIADKTIHITSTERTNWNDANSKKHTHANIDIIGAIDLDRVNNWDAAFNAKHSHSNLEVINKINLDDITNWRDANSKKHTHSNKAVLDGIKSTDITNWNNKLDKSTWNSVFETKDGELRVKVNVVGDGEISAYGKGPSGSTGAITIADNLITEESDVALSARLGVILKNMIDNKEINLDNYYDKNTIDTKLAPKATTEYVNKKVSELNTAIGKKSDKGHTHTKAEITDLDLTPYDTHIADTTKHITANERSAWNNKVDKVTGKGLSTNDYTTTEKNKLKGIAEGANKYTHPANHPATMITEDKDHRFTTDAEKSTWNDKASTAVATQKLNGLMSNTDKLKLDGIEAGANKYVHPSTHPATMITEDASHRFFTDTERTKLSGIATGANKYVHPSTHPATMITEDTTHRFVTDAEKTKWNNKLDKSVWDKAFYYDGDDLKVKLNLIGDKEVSAYGKGATSSGGAITIVDALTSEATDAALSANQGRILKNMIDNKEINLDNYYDKDTSDGRYAYKGDIKTKTSQLTNDSGYITNVANAFNYNNLSNKPTIPSNTNQLTNGAGFITSSALNGYAKTSAIPTKVSQLTNDKGYITGYTNNYLSSITGSANGEVTFNRSGLDPLKFNFNHTHSQYLTSSSLNGYAKTSAIPTKVSQLTNDKGYITGYTNNYLTGVSGSGNGTVTFTRSGLGNLTWNASHTHSQYLTSHQSIAHLANKDGSNASGTWGISITGNAATATNADKVDGIHASAIPYAVNPSLGYGTSEETGRSSSLSRSMFWRDNNRGSIGMYVQHSENTGYGWEVRKSYDNNHFYTRYKAGGKWSGENTIAFTSDNVASATNATNATYTNYFKDTNGTAFDLKYGGTGNGETSADYLACFTDSGNHIAPIQPNKLSVNYASSAGGLKEGNEVWTANYHPTNVKNPTWLCGWNASNHTLEAVDRSSLTVSYATTAGSTLNLTDGTYGMYLAPNGYLLRKGNTYIGSSSDRWEYIYCKNLDASGNIRAAGDVIAYQVGEGGGSSTSTVVYDKLDSTDGTIALSANQGRLLNNKITLIDEKFQPKGQFKTVNNQSILGTGNINISAPSVDTSKFYNKTLGLVLNTRTIYGSVSLSANDDFVIVNNSSWANITLPSSAPVGKIIHFKQLTGAGLQFVGGVYDATGNSVNWNFQLKKYAHAFYLIHTGGNKWAFFGGW